MRRVPGRGSVDRSISGDDEPEAPRSNGSDAARGRPCTVSETGGAMGKRAIASLVLCLLLAPLRAETIAFSASLSGYGRIYGQPTLDGARLAAEEAGVHLDVHDDKSSAEGAQEVAREIVASDALVVVGPILTPTSLAAGPIYA